MIKTHKDMNAWKFGMDLAIRIYKISNNFPDNEKYGLTSQIRRAAISVPSNIAEGAARNTIPDYIKFLYISLGSLSEIDTQIELANRLGYFAENNELQDQINSTRKLLLGLIKYQKNKI